MKKRLHWRLISMLVVLCMTLQLVPVIAVQAEDHDHTWGEWTEIKDGVYERACSECKDVQTGVRVQYDYITNGGESIDIKGTDLEMDGGYAMAIVPMGESVDLSPTASRSDGFEFYGWSEGMLSPVVKDSIEITDAEPILLYAAFKRDTGKTVSFWSKDSQLQGQYEIMEYNEDGFFGAALNGDEELIDMMYMPDRMDGWSADGWVMDEGADEATYNDSEQIETIEEQYILLNNEDGEGNPIENYYAMYYRELSLTYDVSGYDAVAPSENTFDQYYNSAFGNMSSGDAVLASVTLTDDPVYRWVVDDKLYFPGDTVTLTKTATMEEPSATARLVLESDLLTVTYDTATNGGSAGQVPAKQAANGMKADLTPVAEPYVGAFVGWNTDKDAHEGLTELIVNEDTTLYAIYKRTEHAEFHHSEESVDYGVEVDVYNNETKAGYIDPVPTPKPYGTLQGWEIFGWSNSTAADDNIVNMEDAFGVPCVPDITKPYYAIHHRELSVTYDTGGHESVGGTPYGNRNIKFDQYHHATGVTSPYTVVSFESLWTEDDDFECWVDGNGNEYTGGENITPTNASVTLTAKWHSDTVYTVTFEDYDGTQTNKAAVYPDYKVTAPAEKGREGYSFDGWFNGAVQFNPANAVTASITYTAKYTKLPEYTVTFTDYDDTATNVKADYTNEWKIEAPKAKGRAGYTFEGWFDGSDTEFDPALTVAANASYTAKYTELPKYTVTFTDYDGTKTERIADYTNEWKISAPAAKGRTNYSFEGWFDATNAEFDPDDTIEKSGAYTARYTAYPVVTYDYETNGGASMEGDATRPVMPGAEADLTPTAEKEGYKFVGWNTDKNSHTAIDDYTVSADVTLYAIFSRESLVRFYSQPGRPQAMIKAQSFNNETDWTLESVPTPVLPDGWTSLGWTTKTDADGVSGMGPSDDPVTITDPSTSFYAVGSRELLIGYYSDREGDLTDRDGTQYYNGSGTVSWVDFTIIPYPGSETDFAAWGRNGVSGTKYYPDDVFRWSPAPEEDASLTFAAVWKETVVERSVSYDFKTNGGKSASKASDTVIDGSAADLSPTAAKDGYSFIGWNTDKFAHEALEELMVTDNVTLYAIFAREVTVSFTNGDGSKEERVDRIFNNDADVSVAGPAISPREGWKSYGWRDPSGSSQTVYKNGAVKTGRDISVEAMYTRNVTLTFDMNGAATYVKPQTKLQNSTMADVVFTLPAPPMRNGYTFKGWDVAGNVIPYVYGGFNTVSLNGNTTAKAVWEEIKPAREEVTITYDYRTNGGTGISGAASSTVIKGFDADLTLKAEKTGWVFVGWNTYKDAHEALASVNADSNITLYAIFKKDITAHFYSGATKGEPQTVTAQLWNNAQTAGITMPQAATFDGWTFDGYRADIHPKAANYRENAAEISKDTDFYAVYSRELSISFDTAPDQEKLQYYNTGSGAQALTVVSPEAAVDGETANRRFVGYEVTTEDGTQRIGANQPFTVQNAASVIAKYVEIPAGAQLPKVETKGASVSSYTSAELGLTVVNDNIPGNEIISKGFVYWSKNDVASKYTVMTDGDVSALSNLAQGTEYYYYAYAENAAGIGKGTIRSFKTDSDKTPNAIMISPEYVAIEKGGVYQLLATLLPQTAANREIFWSSSDPSVVTVDASGKLTGVSDGQAIITATTEVGRLTAECIVDVTTKQEAKEYDFSEWHMASHMGRFDGGFDWDVAVDGGNYQMSTAYLARWSGAVQEADDPYPVYDGNTKSKVHKDKDAIMHVQDVEWIPRREGALDNDDIKSALMEYGAVYTTMNIDWSCFSNGDVNYYCNYPTDMNSHAITIVGWDDNYQASRFKTKAPANGAFLCKNSWGSAWGADGYFYISYYDVNLGRKDSNAVFRNAQSANNYNKIYQYDPLGAIGYIGYPETTYAANVFPEEGKTVTGDESLKAVSFYTYQKNTTYDVYIVTDYKDKSSLEEIHTPNVSGTIKNAGYHTIELKTPVEIKKGTRFAVIVKYDTPGQDSYVYFEYPVGGYSSSAKANKGESFMAGDPYLWEDITDYVENADFCIKAFTDNGLASVSEVLYSGVDNENREYESDRVYSLDEARENGCGISDEFIDYMNGEETASLSEAPTLNLGNIPSIAKTGSNTVSFTEGAMFPPSYDLRDMGLVSSVKDQGQWGTCWAHTTYASLESAILKKAKTTHSEGSASEAREIILSRADAIMGSDAAITLAKKILPLNLSDKSVKWISSDDKVVTVDANGTIRSVGSGVASVSASTNAGGKVAECSVIVDNSDIPKTVTLESHTLRKDVGDKFMVAYSVNPVTADDKNMTWISDNTNTASVSDNGVIEVVGEGSANISIISEGIIMDTVTVTAGSGFNLEAAEINDEAPGEVSVTAVNGASSDQSTTVMLGIYKGKRLVSAKLTTKVLAPGANTVTIDGISDDMKDGSTYKCMLWNAASDMVPMGAAMTQEK